MQNIAVALSSIYGGWGKIVNSVAALFIIACGLGSGAAAANKCFKQLWEELTN